MKYFGPAPGAPISPAGGERLLRRADLAEEISDLIAQLLALRLQRLRSLLHILGGGGCRVRIGLHARDVVGNVLGAVRRKLRRARDLLGGGALLLHSGGNRGRDLVDLADDAADALDGVDGFAGDLLNVGDLLGDFLGRLRGLARQRFDFGGDHREAAAGFAGARGLDGGVERQQVGLRGNGVDQTYDFADPTCRLGEPLDGAVGVTRLADRAAGDAGGVRRLL